MIRASSIAVTAALLVAGAVAYSSGLDSCTLSPSHGTSKSSSPRATVTLLNTTSGAAVSEYVPGVQYTLRLFRAGKFSGLTVRPFRGTTTSNPSGTGTLTSATNSRNSPQCSSQLTHINDADKTEMTGLWTAPAAGTGTVSFWAAVVTSYSDPWEQVSLTMPELVAPSPTASTTPSANPSTSVSASPSTTPSPTQTPSVAPSSGSTPSGTPSVPPSSSPSPSITPSGTPTATPTATSSPRPTQSTRPATALTETARVSFMLSQAPQTESDALALNADLHAALLAELGTETHRLGNFTAEPGSLTLTMLVLPPMAEDYEPESVGSLTSRVLAALGNSTALASKGGEWQVLTRLDASSPVTSVVGSSYADLLAREEQARNSGSAYQYSVPLGSNGAITLRWSLEDSTSAVGGRVLRGEIQFSHDSWAAVGFKKPGSGLSGMEGVWGILALPSAQDSSVRAQEMTLHNTTLGGVVARGADAELLQPAQLTSTAASGRRLAASGGSGATTHRVTFQRSLASKSAAEPWGISLPDGGPITVVYAWGTDASESASLSSVRMHQAGKAGQSIVDLGTGSVQDVPLSGLGVAHGVLMFLVWYILMPSAIVLATLSRAFPKGALTSRLVMTHIYMQLAAVGLCVVGFILSVVLSAQRGGLHFSSPHQVMGLISTLLPIANAAVGMMRPPKGGKGRGRWLALHRALALLTLLGGAITLPLGLAEAGADTGLLVVSVLAGVVVAVGVPIFAATCKPSHLPGKAAATIKSQRARSGIVSGMNPLAIAHGGGDKPSGAALQHAVAPAASAPPAITVADDDCDDDEEGMGGGEEPVVVVASSPRDSQRSPLEILRDYEVNAAKATFRPIQSPSEEATH